MRQIVTPSPQPISVALSFGSAFLGSYVCICLCEQLRLSYVGQKIQNVFGKNSLMFFMAVSLGGVGICGMHFIAMLGTPMSLSDGTKITTSIDLFGTLLTLFVVILCCFVGLTTSSFDKVFSKTKKEIIDMFVSDASSMSISAIKKMQGSRILYIISTHNLNQLFIGGAWIGVGCFLMHYVGSMGVVGTVPEETRRILSASTGSVSPEFHLIILWNGGLLFASIAIGFLLAISSVWILFRMLSLYNNKEILRLTSATLMAGASCSMHWVCMSGATFILTDDDKTNQVMNTLKISPVELYYGFIAAAVMLSVVFFIMVLAYLRSWLHNTSVHLQRADELIELLKKDSRLQDSPLINIYLAKRAIPATTASQNTSSKNNKTPHSSGSGHHSHATVDGSDSPLPPKSAAWFSTFIYKKPEPSAGSSKKPRFTPFNKKIAVDMSHSTDRVTKSTAYMYSTSTATGESDGMVATNGSIQEEGKLVGEVELFSKQAAENELKKSNSGSGKMTVGTANTAH